MARPPVRRMGTPAARAVSITRVDSAIRSASGFSLEIIHLAAHELEAFYTVVLEVDEHAIYAAGVITRPGVKADRPPNRLFSSGLMDMPMQAEKGLMPFDDR